jgi:hypothetical protein
MARFRLEPDTGTGTRLFYNMDREEIGTYGHHCNHRSFLVFKQYLVSRSSI